MSKINKISVDGVTYDIEDKSVPSWAKGVDKPTYKTSELENDSGYIKNTDYASSDNAGLIKSESYYGLHTSSRNGTLYCEKLSYDEYTNEKDDNCFISKGTLENVIIGKGLTGGGTGGALPIASASTLGGIKVGTNLTIDEEGVLSAIGGSGSSSDIYSSNEQVVGTYFDKPLYKKTYTGIIQYEYAGTYYTIIKLDNGEKFERVIDFKGFFSDTTNEVGNLYDIHIEGVFPIKLSNGNVDLRAPQMFYNKYFEVTLYYTKATV